MFPIKLSVALLASVCLAAAAAGVNLPPKNPYLAHSSYPIGHGTAAQQDSVPQAGPVGRRIVGAVY